MFFIDENGEEEGWLLNEDVIELIGLHSQEAEVQIIQNGDELVQRMRTQVGMICQVNYSVQVCRQ